MKKNKPPLFTPAQYAAKTNEDIGNSTLEESISRNRTLLMLNFFDALLDKDDFFVLVDSIRNAISTPAKQSELMQIWNSEPGASDKDIRTLLGYARHACLYIELADLARKKNDINRAWAFNNYSSIIVGEILGKTDSVHLCLEAKERTERNRKNARGRNKTTLELKKEIARLLEKNKPADGWPYKTTAITCLEQPVIEFIEKHGVAQGGSTKNVATIGGVTSTNLHRRLSNWLLTDEIIRKAWEKTCKSR